MPLLNAVIIDDKPANIDTLRSLVTGYCPEVTIAGTATNVDDGQSAIHKHKPHVVFLDIEMPGGNGFDLLRRFGTLPFEVIFTTAYDQYAIQAFREHALDYLLKPIDIDVLRQAVQKARNQIELKQVNEKLVKYLQQLPVSAANKISLPTQDGYLFINPSDIIRCEASGSYSHFHMADGRKILVSMRLKECEEILPSGVFFRIHHSHIINLQCVNVYVRGRGGYVTMHDGSKVEVSVSKKEEFLESMKFH